MPTNRELEIRLRKVTQKNARADALLADWTNRAKPEEARRSELLEQIATGEASLAEKREQTRVHRQTVRDRTSTPEDGPRPQPLEIEPPGKGWAEWRAEVDRGRGG